MERDAARHDHGAGFSAGMSLWMLPARGSIYKTIGILTLMSLIEAALFSSALRMRLELQEGTPIRFETVFTASGAAFVFVAAFSLVFFVLLRCEAQTRDSRPAYTLKRLRTSQLNLFFVKAAYNFLCLVLLMAVQAWEAIWMCGLYGERIPAELSSPQLVFLAFYRTAFLHNLIPLAETGRWVQNLLMLLALSALAASEERLSAQDLLIAFLFALNWGFSGPGVQTWDVLTEILACIVIVTSFLRIFGLWDVDRSVREERQPEDSRGGEGI